MMTSCCAKTHAGLLAGKCPWCGTWIAPPPRGMADVAEWEPWNDRQTCRFAQRFYEYLSSRQMRVTTLRRRIAEQVASLEGHFSASELLASLPGVPRPTVYRCLDDLIQAGMLIRTDVDQPPRYQRVASE